jgi:hypothetical protein
MSETFRDRLVELRLTRAYIHLLLVPVDGNGARTVPLARFGNYEVRLTEFVQETNTDSAPMWLELYARDLRRGIDSCCCYDLEEAVDSARHLVARARELNTAPDNLSFETSS